MIYHFIIIILLYTHSFSKTDGKRDGHSGQKKQFVNFGDNSFSKEYDGGEELYGGGGGGGGGGGEGLGGGYGGGMEGGGGYDGGMQLSENAMGALNYQGNGMESLGSLLGESRQFGSLGGSDGISDLLDGGGGGGYSQFAPTSNYQTSFEAQGDQSMAALGLGPNSPMNRGESLFSSIDGNNADNDDLISPLDGNSLEGKLENSINLGDSVNTPGIGQFEMSSFDDMKDYDGIKNGASVLPAKEHGKAHKQGDDRQGIGAGGTSDMQALLSNELGELDSSDEKLQKMLESGLNSDSSFSDNGDGAGAGAGGGNSGGTADSGLSALLNPQGQMDQMDAQQSSSPDEMPNLFGGQDTQQQTALNQLSGTMSQNSLGSIQPVTVHAHASDKPGSDAKDTPPPEESLQTAQQVQETASKAHKVKLMKLKKRLKLLREKLTQLEDEQAKKSTSNKNNDPKAARNDAIKKLLIKNLKLAAMIASKEIQLEEAKGRGLAYLSGKKEDSAEVLDDFGHDKIEQTFAKAKPLTELSKKAEEEVNHLSKNPDMDKSKSNTTANAVKNNKILENAANQSHHTNISEGSNTFLQKINETLQVLDKTAPEVHTRSTLTASSKRFLKKLQKQIQSMSPPQVHAIEEKALATLFRAIKTKATTVQEKKKSSLRQQRQQSLANETLSNSKKKKIS